MTISQLAITIQSIEGLAKLFLILSSMPKLFYLCTYSHHCTNEIWQVTREYPSQKPLFAVFFSLLSLLWSWLARTSSFQTSNHPWFIRTLSWQIDYPWYVGTSFCRTTDHLWSVETSPYNWSSSTYTCHKFIKYMF